jgi:ABC-type transport system substrate-binding protein
MIGCTARLALTAPAALLLASLGTSAQGQGTLRVAMTASDVPTTTGAPDNGFEGLRFLGYPVYEGLVLWDLTRADRLAEIRPGLAESWEQDKNDRSKWIFHLRRDVKFHDGNDFQRRRGDLEPRPLFQAGRTAS